jgi:hypothetical protein
MNQIIIRQPAGLGDIFFTQKIAHILHQYYNCNIVWPVIKEFIWIKDYLKIPFIEFINEEYDFVDKDALKNDVSYIFEWGNSMVIPLQRADLVFTGSVMHAKYKLVDLDFYDWVDYFLFSRNIERENYLYYDVLGLKDGEEYIFVNKNFASPPNNLSIKNIEYSKNIKTIEMDFLGFDNLFDWCKVIENAKEIYTVETSICYILEKLICKSEKIFLYSRNRKADFSYMDGILKKNYLYYEGRCI